MIDTHSHLNLEQFESDYEEVIEQMKALGVRTQTVGVDVDSSVEALRISARFPESSRAVVGIHPAYVEAGIDYHNDVVEIARLLDNELCVGVGECGFDYFRCNKSEVYDAQRAVFVDQIQLAVKYLKPLMLHLRPSRGSFDAYDDAIEILESYKGQVIGQAHFFAGTIQQAKRFLDMGYYISVTGVVTFTGDYDELVRYVPMDRILMETDSPYVAPTPYRGGRCLPQYVAEVYRKVTELKNVPQDVLVEQMDKNVKELYRW